MVVHVANSVAALVELDSDDPDDASPIDPRALDQLGLTLDFISDTVKKHGNLSQSYCAFS